MAQSHHTYIVNQRHSEASDQNPGTVTQPFLTIGKAASLAQPGDTVLVQAGVYRERVAPARGGEPGKPIVYMAVQGKEVYIKGSELWQADWKETNSPNILYGAFPENIFAIKVPDDHRFDTFPAEFNPYTCVLRKAPGSLDLNLGQLFVDGQPLIPVDHWDDLERISGAWMVNEERSGLYVHFPFSYKPLKERMVELTVRPRVFAPYRRGLGYIHCKGFYHGTWGY